MKRIPNLPEIHLIPLKEVEEKRPVLLVTSGPAWENVREKLRGLWVTSRLEPMEATVETWDMLLDTVQVQAVQVVYAVGGGLSADAAKYFASRLSMPLVMVPTALSVDAFMTAVSGVRRDGCVTYIPTLTAGKLILDLELIATAPPRIRAAGMCDVLSIATGCSDWKLAEAQGQNPAGMEYVQWAHDNAQTILQAALDCAEAAGRGDLDGLKCLLDCLALEVQLCNQLGHARPKEGSEHYFAYCAEQFTGPGWPHGDLVGPGILLMAKWQGQNTLRLERALIMSGTRLEHIPEEVMMRTRRDLADYCRRHGLPFGIAHIPEKAA